MPYHTYYHCSCQVICVTYSHAVSPSGYTDVQNRSTFLVTIVAYIVCMVRVFLCVFPAKHVVFQHCCVETKTKLSQKDMEINIFHPSFPDSLLLLGLPSVSDQYWAEFYFCGFCPIILPHPIHNCGHHAQNMMKFCKTFTK